LHDYSGDFYEETYKITSMSTKKKGRAGQFFLGASNNFGVLGKNGIILPQAEITKIFCLP
jgi:hypothetical protein